MQIEKEAARGHFPLIAARGPRRATRWGPR